MATFDPFDWAAGAAAADAPTRPQDAEIDAGYAFGEVPTSKELNWLFSYLGKLSRSATAFDSLEAAVDGLSPGESATVHEDDDGASTPGSTHTRMQPVALATEPTQHTVVAIDTDGRNVAFATARGGTTAKVYLYARNDLAYGGTALLALTPATADDVAAVLYDGTYLVAAYGDYVRCWDSSGSVVWTYNHGAKVVDIAMDGTRVYFVGTYSSSVSAGAVLLSSSGTASAAWTYDHGATLDGVCTDGVRVFVGGTAGTGGVTLRSLNASTGSTTGPGTWSLNTAGTPVAKGLRTDGRIIVQANVVASGVATLEVRGCARGQVIAARQHLTLDAASAIVPSSVALDDQYVYVSHNNAASSDTGGVQVYHRNLEPAYAAFTTDDGTSGTGNTLGVMQVVSDGQSIFAGHNIDSAGSTDGQTILARYYRAGAGRRFLRVDTSNDYLPARSRVIPEGW